MIKRQGMPWAQAAAVSSMLAGLALANADFGTVEVVVTKFHDLSNCLAVCTGIPKPENNANLGSLGGSLANGHQGSLGGYPGGLPYGTPDGSPAGSPHGSPHGSPGDHPGGSPHGVAVGKAFTEPTPAPDVGFDPDCEYITLDVPTHGKHGATKTVGPGCDGCYGTIYHYAPTDRPFVTRTTHGSGRWPTVSLKLPEQHCDVCEGTVYICEPTSPPKGSWFGWKAEKHGNTKDSHQGNKDGPDSHHHGSPGTQDPKHGKHINAGTEVHDHGNTEKKIHKESSDTTTFEIPIVSASQTNPGPTETSSVPQLLVGSDTSIAPVASRTTREEPDLLRASTLPEQLVSSSTSTVPADTSTTQENPEPSQPDEGRVGIFNFEPFNELEDESTASSTTTTTTTSRRTYSGIANTISATSATETPSPTETEIIELTEFDVRQLRTLEDYMSIVARLVRFRRNASNWTFDWETVLTSSEVSSNRPYDWSQMEISLDGSGISSAPNDVMNFFKLLLIKVGDQYTSEELLDFLKRYLSGSSDDIPSEVLDFFKLFFSGHGNFGAAQVEFQSATSELLHFLNLYSSDSATIENTPLILLNFLESYLPSQGTPSDIMNFLNLYLTGNPNNEEIPAELLRFFKAYFPGKGTYIYEPSDLVDFVELYNSGQATPDNVPPELLDFFRTSSSDNNNQVVPLDVKSNLNLFLAGKGTPDNIPPELLNFFKTYFLGYDKGNAVPEDWNSFIDQYASADPDTIPLNWKNFFDIYFRGDDAQETTDFDWTRFFGIYFSGENGADQSNSPYNQFLDYWFSGKSSENPLLSWAEFDEKYYSDSNSGTAPADWTGLFNFDSATMADREDLENTVAQWLEQYSGSVGGTSGLKANLLDLYNLEDGLNVSGEVLDAVVTELERSGLTSTEEVSETRLQEIKDSLNKDGIHTIVDEGGTKTFENLGLALGLAKGVPLLSNKIVQDAMAESQCDGLRNSVACLLGQIVEEAGVDTAALVQHVKEANPDFFTSAK